MIFNTIQERICTSGNSFAPVPTPFGYKMPKLSLVDSPEFSDPALVHLMQVAVGTLNTFKNHCNLKL
jgi:hypothetical protein